MISEYRSLSALLTVTHIALPSLCTVAALAGKKVPRRLTSKTTRFISTAKLRNCRRVNHGALKDNVLQ